MNQAPHRQRAFAGLLICALVVLAATVVPQAQAKWRSESFNLKAGWNAIYLFVDPSHEPIQTTLASYPQIEEVWRWQPDGLSQRILSAPDEPVSGPEWAVWKRSDASSSTITELRPNFAYLIKVADAAADFTLNIKGAATLPRVVWRVDGVNLIGFPVAQSTPPTFKDFLDASVLISSADGIYHYIGGALGSANPAKIPNPGAASLARGKAYWVNIGQFSRYYGPLRIEIMGGDGLNFSERNATIQILVTNLSDKTISTSLLHENSDTPPTGQKTIAGKTPLLLRSFDSDTATYVYETVDTAIDADIPGGASRAWVFGVDRSAMAGNPGDLYASRLKVTGGTGTEIYLPVSATVSSTAGLWIGEASLSQVASLVRLYERDPDTGATNFDDEGNPLLTRDEQTDPSASDLPETDQRFPLRLIVHVDKAGKATLLSHAFIGMVSKNGTVAPGITTDESLLEESSIASAARVASASLPFDTASAFTGQFGKGQSLSLTITVPYDSPSNPFVHAYHPDHDNLDARFENKLPAGQESYTFSRVIKLDFDANGSASGDPSWGATQLTGVYQETITGVHKDDIRARGTFLLYRVSDIANLTTP